MPDIKQYLTLGLDRELFGIDIAHVHQILDMEPIAALPQGPAFLLGMIDVRGAGYPVIDLRRKLGLPATVPTPATRIVVVHVPIDSATLPVGLVADRVIEVTTLDHDQVVAPPEVGGRWQATYIAGIGRRKGAFVILFDLAKLMASDIDPLSGAPLSAAVA